jgi:hypothetical protein
VRVTPTVSEEGYPGHEAEAVELLRGIGGPHNASVVCSQGDVIPDLLSRITSADAVDLPAQASKKASTWALTFQLDRLISCEYFPPPAVGDVNASAG